jgi:hypothetical protein
MIENQTLSYALFIIAIFLIVIGSLLSYLIVMRVRQVRREQHIKDYINKYQDTWYRYLVLGEDVGRLHDSRVMDSYIKEAVDRILKTYISSINNPDVLERISHFCSLNFKKHYRSMLYHRNWGVRMNGLYRTLDFRLSFLLPDIEHLLKKKRYTSEEEYLVILRILSMYNRNLFLAHFYHPSYSFKEFQYKTLLSHMDESYIEEFIYSFSSLPPYLKIALLDYLSFNPKMDISYLKFYESLLSNTESEIQIHALKAIGHFGMITSIRYYQGFINSPHWEERLMLAKLLIHVEEKDAKPLLEKLLQDKSWWVRKQAAITLNSLRYGVEVLQRIAEQKEDLYAAEMAKEILQVG